MYFMKIFETFFQTFILIFLNVCFLILVIDEPEKIWIVMEYAAHGELYELLIKNGALPSDVARDMFKQILAAVHHSMLFEIKV